MSHILKYSLESRVYLIKNAVRGAIGELDPALVGNEHLTKCYACGREPDDDGLFHHHDQCQIVVLQTFLKDPIAFLSEGGHNEAGKHFLTPRE